MTADLDQQAIDLMGEYKDRGLFAIAFRWGEEGECAYIGPKADLLEVAKMLRTAAESFEAKAALRVRH